MGIGFAGIEPDRLAPAAWSPPLQLLTGGMIIAAEADDILGYTLAFVAVLFGAMNVVGGYVVTDRMLQMFKKKPEDK